MSHDQVPVYYVGYDQQVDASSQAKLYCGALAGPVLGHTSPIPSTKTTRGYIAVAYLYNCNTDSLY